MAQSSTPIEVYLEIGKKRTFAGALDWPGWCRGGRDEPSALQAFLRLAEDESEQKNSPLSGKAEGGSSRPG